MRFSGFYVFFLVPDIWYLIPDIWISGYLDIWYLDTWIPLIKIHGGEAKYMVGKPYMVGSPHTWWPGQPAGQLWWGARLDGGQGGWSPSNLAPHQSWPAGWQGHHVCGLPTMYGFPTMYFDQGYQDFRYRVSEKIHKQQKKTISPKRQEQVPTNS